MLFMNKFNGGEKWSSWYVPDIYEPRLICTLTLIIHIYTVFAVGEETVSSIGQGLCVLIGIGRYDTEKELEYM